jgi:hypothetical protein
MKTIIDGILLGLVTVMWIQYYMWRRCVRIGQPKDRAEAKTLWEYVKIVFW